MAELNLQSKILSALRHSPSIYRLIRAPWRGLKKVLIEVMRCFDFGPPKNFFDGIGNARIKNTVVLEAQVLQQALVGSLRGRCGLGQNGGQPWPIFWLSMGNIRLVGKSLAPMNSKRELLSEAAYGDPFRTADPSFNFICLSNEVKLKGTWTSLSSRWDQGYYHWFMDCLPRLAMLNFFPADCRILISGEERRYQRESLELLNLYDRCLFTKHQNIGVENYYFGSPTSMTGCDNPFAIRWLREQFLDKGEPGVNPVNIYISRKNKTRGIINAKEVESWFYSHGWSVIDTETLSLSRQIDIFSNAKMIVGAHGAGNTNILWCKPGTKLLELFPNNFLNGCYEGIAQYLDVEYHYATFQADSNSCFEVPLSKLNKLVEI